MSALSAGLLGLFVGTIVGIAVMQLITPYCCRLQPEEDE